MEVTNNEMESNKDLKTEKKKEEKKKEKKGLVKKILSIVLIVLVISGTGIFFFTNKKEKIEVKVKSTLDKIVEKSDLETVNITYNVIAKKCKKEEECDKSSNNINDFQYVVSCKGTITAGIDFKDVEIEVNKKEKKVIVNVPDATIKGEPNIGSIKFLNGNEVDAQELPNARKLCQETTMEKSEQDNKLIPAAKEQARVVLEEFYREWIKAYDSSYQIEVK